MGKRKNSAEEAKRIKKKLEKWQKRLKKNEEEEERSNTPTESPPAGEILTAGCLTPKEDTISIMSDEDEIPEEILQALGPEGADITASGDPLHQQLALRWGNIMKDGINKETRMEILKKYPDPLNFVSSAPTINPEIKAVMSETGIKRDNRLIWRQNMTGKMLIAIGKTLTNVMKGNINTKDIVEHLNNAAKIGAELFHQDTMSRKYFALTGTSLVVKDALKNEKSDTMLFGQNCNEKIKSVQTIQRTGAQLKEKKKNFKSPLPIQQKRSGHNLQPRSYRPAHQRHQQVRAVQQRKIQQRRRSPPQKPRYRN